MQRKNSYKMCFPFLIEKRQSYLTFAIAKTISDIVYENEKSMRSEEVIHSELMRIWNTMLECMYIGCHTWILPGGLMRRRALICIKI
jgi:L-serine dehydratase